MDHKLRYEDHLLNIGQTVSLKMHALTKVSKYMSKIKLRITLKAFVNSQFVYYPWIWMFHSRRINKNKNKLDERALRIVYKYHFSSFEELFSKDKSVTVQQRNFQILATEMCKISSCLSPNFMQGVFKIKINYYNTLNAPLFSSRNIKTDMDYRPSLSWV